MSDQSKLIEEANNSDSFRRINRIQFLLGSYKLFLRNFRELVAHLNYFADPEHASEFWSMRNQWRVTLMADEVQRLLHNFVASAVTLVAHSRKHISSLGKEGIEVPNYQKEIDARFLSNPLVQFVHGLRNHILHNSLASMQSSHHMMSGVSSMSLDASALRRRGDWNVWARQFLDEVADGRVDLLSCVKAYFHQVTEFYQWYEQALHEVLRDDYRIFNEFNDRIHQMWKERRMIKGNFVFDAEQLGQCTLRQAEEVFAIVLPEEGWEQVDRLPPDPLRRCEAIIAYLTKEGFYDEDIFDRARRVFAKVVQSEAEKRACEAAKQRGVNSAQAT